MTQAKARKPAQPPAQPPADPLADLRQDDDDRAPGLDAASGEPLGGDGEAVEVRPMVSEDLHAAMVAEAIATWHADRVSLGFLHSGGRCGCRYLARKMLGTVVPVTQDESDSGERE